MNMMPQWANEKNPIPTGHKQIVLDAIKRVKTAGVYVTGQRIHNATDSAFNLGYTIDVLNALITEGKVEGDYNMAAGEHVYEIVEKKTISIPGNYTPTTQQTKVIVIRKDATPEFNLNHYLRIISQFIVPGTARNYFRYGNCVITTFLTERPIAEFLESLTTIEIECQVVHTEDDAVRAFLAYQESIGHDSLKSQIAAYFDRFQPKASLRDVLNGIVEGKKNFTEEEWELLRDHAHNLVGIEPVDRHDGDREDEQDKW